MYQCDLFKIDTNSLKFWPWLSFSEVMLFFSNFDRTPEMLNITKNRIIVSSNQNNNLKYWSQLILSEFFPTFGRSQEMLDSSVMICNFERPEMSH